ncbi:MAG: BadF/BadG/BcrA/BcrD ATPase family protein [bacterium]
MYYLSIEAGGTKTTGILSDLRGQTVRTKKAGAGNIAVLKQNSVLKLLKELVYGLLEGEDVAKIEGATFAFAGAGRAEEKGIAQKIISEIGIKNFSVMSDAELLYYAIHGEGQGILLEAGTGSVCIV